MAVHASGLMAVAWAFAALPSVTTGIVVSSATKSQKVECGPAKCTDGFMCANGIDELYSSTRSAGSTGTEIEGPYFCKATPGSACSVDNDACWRSTCVDKHAAYNFNMKLPVKDSVKLRKKFRTEMLPILGICMGDIGDEQFQAGLCLENEHCFGGVYGRAICARKEEMTSTGSADVLGSSAGSGRAEYGECVREMTQESAEQRGPKCLQFMEYLKADGFDLVVDVDSSDDEAGSEGTEVDTPRFGSQAPPDSVPRYQFIDRTYHLVAGNGPSSLCRSTFGS